MNITGVTDRFLPASRLLPLLLLIVPSLLNPGSARAYDEGQELLIETEDDIYELQASGELTDEQASQLLTLLQDRLDLNRATAEEIYALPGVSMKLARALVSTREGAGYFLTLEDLLKVPGMSDQILEAIRPFVRVRFRVSLDVPYEVEIDARTAYEFGGDNVPISFEDAAASGGTYRPSQLGLDTWPESVLRLKVDVDRRLSVGLLTTLEEGISDWSYDEYQEAFVVSWGQPLARLRKAYAMVNVSDWRVIVGHYGAGFGQGLVLDETGRGNPHGLYVDDEVHGTTTFSSPDRLFGVAATYQGLDLGFTNIQATAFLSVLQGDASQYAVVMPDREEDGVSTLVLLDDIPLMQQTLPDVYEERLLGAHVAAVLDKRNYLGITAYMSNVKTPYDYSVETVATEERLPIGVVGADFGALLHPFVLNGEVAVMNNASLGAYLRGVVDLGPGELLLSFRSYGTDFDNPHSGGYADADVLDRERDRDEVGAFIQGGYRFTSKVRAYATYNQWYRPSLGVMRLETTGRFVVEPNRKMAFSLTGGWKDKNLAVKGRSRCYATTSSDCFVDTEVEETPQPDEDQEDFVDDEASTEGNGVRSQVGLRFRVSSVPRLTLSGFVKRTYTDDNYEYYEPDGSMTYGWKVGSQAWLKAQYRVFGKAVVSSRFRYLDEDVYGDSGERSYEWYLDFTQRMPKRWSYTLRYTLTQGLPGHTTYEDLCCGPWIDESCLDSTVTATDESSLEAKEHALRATLKIQF